MGLTNQGATCYLNAALQSLYACPEFRQAVYLIRPEESRYYFYVANYGKKFGKFEKETLTENEEKEARDENMSTERIIQSSLSEQKMIDSVAISNEITLAIDELVDLYGFEGADVKHALERFEGDKENAVNWLLDGGLVQEPIILDQLNRMEHLPAVENIVENAVITEQNVKPRRIPIELQRLFARLQLSDANYVSTSDLTDSFGWIGAEVFQQQDVFELTQLLLDALERSLVGTSHSNLVMLFKGRFVNRVLCKECKLVSFREEDFLGLPLSVQNCENLHQGLKMMTEVELFEGKNQYFCSTCCKKTDAAKSTVFKHLPEILMINLNRFTWNEKGQRCKLTHKCAFPLELDMEPYLEKNLPIAELVFGNMKPPCPAYFMRYTASNDEIANVDVNKDENIEQEEIGAKQSDRKKKIKNESQGLSNEHEKKKTHCLEGPDVNLSSSNCYELFAVLIHSGNAYGGHYTAYIKDLMNAGIYNQSESKTKGSDEVQWFSFNDAKIEAITVQQIATQYGSAGRSEAAYMLFYRIKKQVPIVSVPEFLQKEVDAENLTLIKERLAHELAINKIIVRVFTPDLLLLTNDVIEVIGGPQLVEIDRRKCMLDLLQVTKDSEGYVYWSRVDLVQNNLIIFNPMKFDANISLLNLKVGNNDAILFWNGSTICGQVPAISVRLGQAMSIELKYLVRDTSSVGHSSCSFLFQGIKDDSTVQSFMEFIQNHLRLSLDALWLHVVKPNEIVPFDIKKYATCQLLTSCAEISGSCTIIVEEYPAVAAKSLAAIDFAMTKSRIRLLMIWPFEISSRGAIMDRPFGEGHELWCSSNDSLLHVKLAAIQQLPNEFVLKNGNKGFRLRRIVGQSKLGGLFLDESKSLAELEMDENDLFILIENENLPQKDSAEINVCVKKPDGSRSEHNLIVDLKLTVREAKCVFLKAAGLACDAKKFCLYRTNTAWNEKGKLFGNENLSLEKLTIANGDSLWLEEGKIPCKGLLKLDFYLFQPFRHSNFDFARTKMLEPLQGQNVQDSSQVFAYSDELKNENAVVKLGGVASNEISGTKFLFSLEAQQNQSLKDLKIALHSHESISKLAQSIDFIRLRAFRSKHVGSIFSRNDDTLQKQGITSDRSLVVQIVLESEANLSFHAMIFQSFLFKQISEKETLWSPFPVEVLWDGGADGSFESLYSTFSIASKIPIHFLCLAKWVFSEKRWAIISRFHESNEWDILIANEKKKHQISAKDKNFIGKREKKGKKGTNMPAYSDEEIEKLIAAGIFDENTPPLTVKVASEEIIAKKGGKKNDVCKKGSLNLAHIVPVLNSPLHSRPYCLKDADIILAIDMRDLYSVPEPFLHKITTNSWPGLPIAEKDDQILELENAVNSSLADFASSKRLNAETGIHIKVDV